MTACKGACQSSSRREITPEIASLVHDHPCYSEEAHYHYARMHLAVAPACNIQCRYCNRLYDCVNESRPGVTSEVLSPEEAARKTIAVVGHMPHVSVVGIAGPGDPLANPEKTFRTFELIREKISDVRFCLSTNGLALPEHVDRLKALGIHHVTITINAVDPQMGKDVYQWVHFDHKRYTGADAAAILIERQLLGLQALTDNGILCKVNSVLIPGINDSHLAEVSREVRSRGAFLHNIMPLIVVQGADYAAHGFRGPTLAERKRVEEQCGGEVRLMHHCRQCRSDALGLLGEDLATELTLEKLPEEVVSSPELRQRAREEIEADIRKIRLAGEGLKRTACGETQRIVAAVASKGHGVINEHFGHAREFLIYEASSAGIELVQVRKVDQYCRGSESCGDEETLLADIVVMLSDCQYVLCSRIGPDPRRYLEQKGIRCIEVYDSIHDVLARLVHGEELYGGSN
ncbi:MAG: nitrogenase cofactor biosynthesis protein NifB [Chloroflexota bacterium]|nr:MAG: nitrogenase cofactor biosynthesis protein NifB [Chloroflexota bacterium]